MTDREIDREILTPTARLLLWLYDQGGMVEFKVARKQHGSKIYPQLYRLALLGLVTIDNNNRIINITENGKRIASCIKQCIRHTNN